VVSRPGSDRRADLLALLGPAAQGKRLALLYVGAFGMPLPYERLAEFDGWHFLSLAPLSGTAPNLTFAEQDWMPHPDLVASVDVVVSKLGYGIVGECLGGGTAILFPPRPGFAEHPVLEAEVRRTGHGVPLDTGPFLSLDWAAALAAVPAHGTLPCLAAPGGARAAERIADLYRASGQP